MWAWTDSGHVHLLALTADTYYVKHSTQIWTSWACVLAVLINLGAV